MSEAVEQYREAARRHDGEPSGPGRVRTFLALLAAMRGLSEHEYAAMQHEAQVRARGRLRRDGVQE